MPPLQPSATLLVAVDRFWIGGALSKAGMAVKPKSLQRAVVEALSRRLLIAVSIDDGVLKIIGTESDDRITIATNKHLLNVLTVDFNGQIWNASLAEVRSFHIESLGGADRIRVDSSLDGMSRPSFVNAGSGGDQVFTSAGMDTILGGAGNDRISSGASGDFINGGAGNDLIRSEAGVDTVLGGDGSDKIWGESVSGGVGHDTIYGTDGPDTLHGDTGNDLILGRAGDDQIYGDAGGDAIYGGAGNDTLNAGHGDDNLYGSDGFEDNDPSNDGHDIGIGGAGKDWFDPTHAWASVDASEQTAQVKLNQDPSLGQYDGTIQSGTNSSTTINCVNLKMNSLTFETDRNGAGGINTSLRSLQEAGFLYSGKAASPLTTVQRRALQPRILMIPTDWQLGAMSSAKDDIVWYHVKGCDYGPLGGSDASRYNYLAVHRGTVIIRSIQNAAAIPVHAEIPSDADAMGTDFPLRLAGETVWHQGPTLSPLNPAAPSKNAKGLLVEDGVIWLNVGAYPYFSRVTV